MHQSALVATARLEEFPRISSIFVNKLRLFALTCMRKTFLSRYAFSKRNAAHMRIRLQSNLPDFKALLAADIGPSYQVRQQLSTKLRVVYIRRFPFSVII